MLKGFEFKTEQEYYDWEEAITMIQYYEKIYKSIDLLATNQTAF
jgi:hypothetical protein